MLRPIAGALMTVGLAGLLVSTAPMLNLGFAGSAATSTENRDSQSPGVSTDSTPVPGTYAPETLASAPPPGDQSASGGGQYGEGAKTPDPTPAADRTDPNKQLSGTSAGESERLVRTTLPWGSGVLLVFGLGLLVTRRIARRLG
ncbi:MAG: hypothetical protein ABI598_04125 [Chloroflexota bacterium]